LPRDVVLKPLGESAIVAIGKESCSFCGNTAQICV
jgi:hypothetical protein